jgi:nitroreductase
LDLGQDLTLFSGSRRKEGGIVKNGDAAAVFKAIRERRSVRAYLDRDVPKELILKILEAGHWAPTGYNVQAARFFVLQEDKKLLESFKAFAWGLPKETPCAIVISNDERFALINRKDPARSEVVAAENLAMVAQNMMLMAYSLGLGTCVVGSYSPKGIEELLDFPEHLKSVLILGVGYPRGEIADVPRKQALDAITTWEAYSKEE